MKLNKTPGPDGLTTEFYQHFFPRFRPNPPKNDTGSTQKTNTTRQPLTIVHHTHTQRQPRQDTNEKLQTHFTLKRRLQNY